jgi:hypothetical protein
MLHRLKYLGYDVVDPGLMHHVANQDRNSLLWSKGIWYCWDAVLIEQMSLLLTHYVCEESDWMLG